MKVALVNAHTNYAQGASFLDREKTYAEYPWSVEVNRELKKELEQFGIQSIIIDASSVQPYNKSLLYKTTAIAEAKADIAIENHLNASITGTGGEGFEILYSKQVLGSHELATCIAEAYLTFSPFLPRRVNGLMEANNIHILTRSPCPTVITESFFITNPIERNYLFFSRGHRAIAAIIAVGISEYAHKLWEKGNKLNGSIRKNNS